MPNKGNRRLDQLEMKIEKHLEESGEIRTDIKWIKQAFWLCAGAWITMAGSFAVSLVMYVLRK